jgi:type IV pilus assembly protein PilA
MRPPPSPQTWRTGRSHAGFTLVELLVVAAVIGIVSAIAVPALLRARVAGNEASAIASLRTISSAQQTYSSTCGGGGFAPSLEDLAVPPAASAPFITADLGAAGIAGTPKSGYIFEVVGIGPVVLVGSVTCNNAGDTRSGFFASAGPSDLGVTGTRYFAVDHSAQIRQSDTALTDITSGSPLQ